MMVWEKNLESRKRWEKFKIWRFGEPIISVRNEI